MERPWCVDERCGRPHGKQGRLPNGWVTVKLAGDGQQPIRFCGPRHAGLAVMSVCHGQPVDHIDAPDHDVPALLAVVNDLARTHLTIQTVTPRRLRAALDRAASRVLADLDDWQTRQDRHRPTFAQVQDEMVTGQVAVEADDQPVAEEPLPV